MILEEIRLKNFRCFYGESCIRFSEKPDRNVTIIYAENGVGKTSLLNALLWCFYGITTAKFEKKDEILNYDAKKEGQTLASVEVLFEHNDNRYIAKRFVKIGPTPGYAFLVNRIEGGSQITLNSPDTFVNTVVPRDMASHFLFDGEHAEVFLGEGNRESIKRAVRDILGCSLIETATEDLDAASKYFLKQIPKTAEPKILEIKEKHDVLTEQLDKAKKQIIELESMQVQIGRQIKDIEARLRNTAASKELQTNRDQLFKQLTRTERRLKEYSDEVYKWLGEDGRFVVSTRITEETFSFLDESEHPGRIPSPYNEEFINDLLNAGECICGARLVPDSLERKKVASLLEKAANKTILDRIFKVRARLTSLKDGRTKALRRLTSSKRHLAEANEEHAKVESQLAEIREKLKHSNIEEISNRESRRDELMDELQKVNRQIGSFNTNVNSTERKIKELDNELTKLSKQDKQTAIYGRRRDLCETIKNTLKAQLASEENQARQELRSGISRILKATTHKVLNLDMTDDYVISLVNAEGTNLPKSSGENQLLGLAFTAALVEFAKVRKNTKDDRLLPGTIAPLVLDSPFGQLDEAYRATTAQFIPNMARQVVLLVSESQGSENVLNAIRDYLGAEYLLVRHNKEQRGERKKEIRHFNGENYQTVIFDAEYDGTEIVQISGP